jgi:hypothetical protein
MAKLKNPFQPVQPRLPRKHKTNTIFRRTGSEGPHHDPYSYEEITVEGRNGTTTVHLGLGEWIQNNKGVKRYGEGEEVDKLFEYYTGISIAVAMRVYHTLPYRKHARKCGCKETGTVSGYPGETFEVCLKCGEFVNSRMNYAAIE